MRGPGAPKKLARDRLSKLVSYRIKKADHRDLIKASKLAGDKSCGAFSRRVTLEAVKQALEVSDGD